MRKIHFCAIGMLLAGAAGGSAQVTILYDNLGSPTPYIRGFNGDWVTSSGLRSALAVRFSVSKAATLTGFDAAIQTALPNNITVSIYTDGLGVPGQGAVLGTLVASAMFGNAQPLCVAGSVAGSPNNCVPIFHGTIPGNVQLTPGDYWLALSSSCSNCTEWALAAQGEGVAGLPTSTNIWVSYVDAPWGIRVYGAMIPRVYVVNTLSNSVSVIDTATNAVLATIPVGGHPAHLAVLPNGSRVYVANAHSHDVSVINTATKTVVATVLVGLNPVDVAATPNGAFVYVVNSGSKSVSVIDTATNLVVATIPVEHVPERIAITANGAHAYVTNRGSHTVSVIDTATHNVVTTVAVGAGPIEIVIH